MGTSSILEKAFLQNSYNKYGEDAFITFPLEFIEGDRLLIQDREKFWIAELQSQFNITEVKDNYWTHPEETKDKIANTLRGRELSKEHKDAISKSSPKDRTILPDEKLSRSEGARRMWQNSEYGQRKSAELNAQKRKELKGSRDWKYSVDQRDNVAEGAKEAWRKRKEAGTAKLSDEHRAAIKKSWEQRKLKKQQQNTDNPDQ